MKGYHIVVTELREDPEDWCNCSKRKSEWIYDNKIYTNKAAADKKCKELNDNESAYCYGGFDIGYRKYEVIYGDFSDSIPTNNIISNETDDDTPEHIITFGKYKNKTVSDIINLDPSYLIWADKNVVYFSLTDEERKLCLKNYG